MTGEQRDLALSIWTELRKEILESQKLRAQIIGVKITFLSAGIGLIVANIDRVPPALLAIPAIAAALFDILVTSYSFSIKRIGYYCRHHLEPIMRLQYDWPHDVPLWEEFMGKTNMRQNLSLWGNIGMTAIATVIAVVGLFSPFQARLSVPLLCGLTAALLWDLFIMLSPRRTFLRAGGE